MRSLFSRLSGLGTATLLFSLAVSALVIGVRQLGVLEELELSSFDQLVRWRPDEGTDPRLLVVGVTEEDIQALGKWPTSDQTLDQVFAKLEQLQPRVIGLDLYRDLPVEPGNPELATRLQVNDNIIAICKGSDSSTVGVAPPPTVPESRLGFSDIVVDADGIVRRSLLFITPDKTSKCPATRSFSLQLALQYLEKQGVQAKLTPQEQLQVGSTIFSPIEKSTVGYQNLDTRGYQTLLNYRSPVAVAQQVTLTDVLKGRINPSLVKDRVVLIGVTATSGNDFFNTPYSSSQQQSFSMAGVNIHAQMVSQILSAALNQRSLFWTLPGWGEGVWLWVWSLLGGVLAWRVRHPLLLVVTEVVALGALVGVGYVIFIQQGWVPLVPPALALVVTAASVICYKAYRPSLRLGESRASQRMTSNITGYEETILPGEDTSEANLLLKGRYKIINDLGGGGFAVTYLAEDTQRPGRPHCVIKQLKPKRNDERFLQVARRLFNTEAETLEELGRTNQIPQLLAHFEQDQEFYLVQEFIKGHALSQELILGERLLESQVVAILKDILTVLDFIHTRGFIHRDIKPDNIIRREQDSRLVLIDFGAVKLLETQITEASGNHTVAIGTSGFSPPEQLLGRPAFNSDIYALGIIGIQALTGLLPTQLQKDATTQELMWREYAHVSDKLAAILDKMVRYHQSERYQSAREVIQVLQDLE